jgi:hypothetical protein
MSAGGIGVRGYTVEDHRMLFVCDQRGAADMVKARKFLLRQKEVEVFEWDNKKTKPSDVDQGSDEDGSAAKPDPMEKFREIQAENARKHKKLEREKAAAAKAAAAKEKKIRAQEKRNAAQAARAAREAEEAHHTTSGKSEL